MSTFIERRIFELESALLHCFISFKKALPLKFIPTLFVVKNLPPNIFSDFEKNEIKDIPADLLKKMASLSVL